MNQSGDSIRVVHPLFQEEGGGANPTSPLQLHIGRISQRLAMQLNGTWHSRLPSISNWQNCEAYGAEFGGIFYAVAMWSIPSARMLNGKNWFELRRMAIAVDAPKNTASRMLSVMLRLIKKEHPEIVKLISYQDTAVHTGTIYKASGWTIGRNSKGGEWNRPSRERISAQAASPKIRWEININGL